MATFALAEAFRMVLGRGGEEPKADIAHARLHPGDAKAVAPTVGRSVILGFVVGVLPGAGATLASFFAHQLQQRFKRGDEADRARGVAAPEAANNAACTGSFVPLLTLGIPGSGTTAVLLGVMLSYGIQPGPQLLDTQPAMFWGVIVSMYIGNLVLLALNLPLIPYIARIVYLRRSILVPFVIAFSLLGVYFTSLNTFDIYLMLGFALAGLALRLANFPLAPLLLGFILSGMLEDNLRRTLLLVDGDWALLLDRPASVALFALCVLVWLAPALGRMRRERATGRLADRNDKT